MKTIKPKLERLLDEKAMYHNEGMRGVQNLSKLAEILGYKDTQNFGTLSNGAHIGSLINFLQDNSGAIEAIYEWIGEQRIPEWGDLINAELKEPLTGDE